MRLISLLFIVSATICSFGQSEMRTEQAFLFSPHYALQLPGGDLSERYSQFSSMGLGVDFKFKNNVVLGIDYDWFFGTSVKDSGVFSNINAGRPPRVCGPDEPPL